MVDAQYYFNLSLLMTIAAVIMLAMTIIIWIKLDIRHNLAVLTGRDARKNIDKIRKDAASGNVQANLRGKGRGPVISWNTSANLNFQPADDKTVPLTQDPDPVVGASGAAADEEATVLLTPNPDFIIEREEGTK